MIKKELFKGLIIGIIANVVGFICCAFIFTMLNSRISSVTDTIQASIQNDSIGSLITLGAIPNLGLFFLFLKRNQPYRSRGILISCIIAALFIAFSKLS